MATQRAAAARAGRASAVIWARHGGADTGIQIVSQSEAAHQPFGVIRASAVKPSLLARQKAPSEAAFIRTHRLAAMPGESRGRRPSTPGQPEASRELVFDRALNEQTPRCQGPTDRGDACRRNVSPVRRLKLVQAEGPQRWGRGEHAPAFATEAGRCSSTRQQRRRRRRPSPVRFSFLASSVRSARLVLSVPLALGRPCVPNFLNRCAPTSALNVRLGWAVRRSTRSFTGVQERQPHGNPQQSPDPFRFVDHRFPGQQHGLLRAPRHAAGLSPGRLRPGRLQVAATVRSISAALAIFRRSGRSAGRPAGHRPPSAEHA